MKTVFIILSITMASHMTFAASQKKTKKTPTKIAFNQCIKDIQKASAKIDRTGANLDNIFKRGGYKKFHYFKSLTKTGKQWYLRQAKKVVEKNGESMGGWKYGLPMISSIQTSLAPIDQSVRACSRSCRKLSNKIQHGKQLKRKCQQLKAVSNGFSNFVAERSEAAFTPAIRALKNMGGTRGNHQAIARFIKASQKPIVQVIPPLPIKKPEEQLASDTVSETAEVAL